MPKRGREKYIHCHRNIRNSCLEISCQNDHLSPNRYNCRHLTSTAIALTTNINTPLATPLQREALAYFKSKLTTTFSLSSNPTEIPDIKVIERYFELFDALLFFGSLRGRVELVNADQQAQHAGCPGHTQPIPALEKTFTFSFRKPKPQSSPNLLQRITLFRRDVDARDRQQRLTLSLSALLHEMIHAFFNTWACQSGKCRARKFEKMGEGGHGCLWVDLATACEQVVKEVLGLELNLRRLEAIVSEVVRGVKEGLDVQSLRRDFEEWGLDFAEFEQKVKEKGKTEGPKRSLGGKKLIGDDLAMMAGGLQDSFWNSSDGEGGGSGGSVPSDEEPTIIEASKKSFDIKKLVVNNNKQPSKTHRPLPKEFHIDLGLEGVYASNA
ncbi:hypothetical protein BGZ60DRAFT_521991 [Tricladium varicosporioides]|nr:hypothetical protein BGZ60DRAFT_521991 [Hymenoscyphus varicosporioides]